MRSSHSRWRTSSSAIAWTLSTPSAIACSSPPPRSLSASPCTTPTRTTKRQPRKHSKLLSAKELAPGQQYFGLYLQQLQQRIKQLPALNTPMIGDALIKSDKDTSLWMDAMVNKGIKLDMKDLKQQAAMPLASFLKFDPWTDQVIQIHPSFEPILSSRDKMPFEVEPVYLKLSYFAPARGTRSNAARSRTGGRCPCSCTCRSSTRRSRCDSCPRQHRQQIPQLLRQHRRQRPRSNSLPQRRTGTITVPSRLRFRRRLHH